TRADVHTQPGAYGGYGVGSSCTTPSVVLGVRGAGASWYQGVAPGQPQRTAALAAFAAQVASVLAPERSVWSVGDGFACDQPGADAYLDDWKEVDPAVALLGAWLADAGLGEEVGLVVAARTATQDGT